MLKRIDEFAKKHKLAWGQEKCQVMRTGKHKENNTEWKIGEMRIMETKKYKYLGDIITSDGRYKENIADRKTKLQATTTSIHTIASSEILNRIETSVLLELHEKISIASLLNNAESWNMNKGEETEIEKIEIQALKDLFDLPLHTPNVAVVFSFGTLFTNQRIDQKRLTYLHKILNRQNCHWTKKSLQVLNELDIGWGRHIKSILNKYNLPADFTAIKSTHPTAWKNMTKTAIEKMNHERLQQECNKIVEGILTEKTKTKSIVSHLKNPTYRRELRPEMIGATKKETKTIIIARYGMLECGNNYKGTLGQLCNQCNVIDDENHRLNYCLKWRDMNLCDNHEKVDLNLIHSCDLKILRPVISMIQKVWNVTTANGTMNVL